MTATASRKLLVAALTLVLWGSAWAEQPGWWWLPNSASPVSPANLAAVDLTVDHAPGRTGGAAASQPDAHPAPIPAYRPDGEADKTRIVKFSKATPEEAKAAVEEARNKAVDTVKRLKVDLKVDETRHFMIFSNWPKADRQWLTDTFEAMYSGLAGQFGVDANDSIWYGKLPAYAFDRQTDFTRFASLIDGMTVPSGTAGYAAGRSDGRGHIALWRCGNRPQLTSIILHEGTHAFLGRYRSNGHVCSWLNEGLAQMMVQFGMDNCPDLRQAQKDAVRLARRKVDVSQVFDSGGNIPFEMYPVAMTMTDLLMQRSRKKYVAMINDIKDGMEVEPALKKEFGWDYAQLTRLWNKWAGMDFGPL